MEKHKNTIKCDQCGHEIDVDKAINSKYHAHFNAQNKLLDERKQKLDMQANEKANAEFKKRSAAFEKNVSEANNKINEDKRLNDEARKAIEKEKQDQEQIIESRLRKEKLSIITEAEKKAEDKVANDLAVEKDKANKANTTIINLKADIKSRESNLALKEAEIRAEEQQKSSEREELKMQEHAEQLKQMQNSLKDVNRKANQASMQIQGEAQEVAIENFLEKTFPTDRIEPIAKGVLGADCLQHVNTPSVPNSGIIYYESKRTKDFSNSWVDKFKSDMREKNADIGILVTQAMPKDNKTAHCVNGVWICSHHEYKILAYALRQGLVEIYKAKKTGVNQKDKASQVFAYLNTNEFRMSIEAIVESFTSLEIGLDKEKRAMNKIWKNREKSLDIIRSSTSEMYGALQAISGGSISNVRSLDLDFDEEELDE